MIVLDCCTTCAPLVPSVLKQCQRISGCHCHYLQANSWLNRVQSVDSTLKSLRHRLTPSPGAKAITFGSSEGDVMLAVVLNKRHKAAVKPLAPDWQYIYRLCCFADYKWLRFCSVTARLINSMPRIELEACQKPGLPIDKTGTLNAPIPVATPAHMHSRLLHRPLSHAAKSRRSHDRILAMAPVKQYVTARIQRKLFQWWASNLQEKQSWHAQPRMF